MNKWFHRLILEGAGKTIVYDLVARCQMVPFASPSSIAFDNLDHAMAAARALRSWLCSVQRGLDPARETEAIWAA